MSTSPYATGRKALPTEVQSILATPTVDGNILRLPGQLDRPTYVAVDRALKGIGGKWNRKAGGHVFPFPAAELIESAVETGAYTDRRKSLQFFETPVPLAARMAELANVEPGSLVLEPSAGLGRLIRPLLAQDASILAVEIDETNCAALTRTGCPCVVHDDFLRWATTAAERFDAVVMNPPFAAGQDVTHITAAARLLKPAGRLVAICSEGPFFRDDRRSAAFRGWLAETGLTAEKLPPGTFRESGTDVAARLIHGIPPAVRLAA